VISAHTLNSSPIIIPARLASSRFPGKPLALINGEPMLLHTYRAACKVSSNVMVGTCDEEIGQLCIDHDIQWYPTPRSCPNGTKRAAIVAQRHIARNSCFSGCPVVVWQVDEPFVNPDDVKALFSLLREYCTDPRNPNIATLVAPAFLKDMLDVDVVKAVVSNTICHWFSRAAIGRNAHVGIYGFRDYSIMEEATNLVPSWLSKMESLEQLTWIEAGMSIVGLEIKEAPKSINSPEDLIQ